MRPSRATTTLRRRNPFSGRFAALIVAGLSLAACGARGAKAPAWPEAAERETDGGESIAPREASAVAAIEKETAEEAESVAPAAAAAAVTAADATTTPAVTETTITAPEDSIMIEEIVIEISDDE